MDEVITEFLVESLEGLDQLDLDLVALEETPDASDILARIFRVLHTIKGSSGFLGYEKLGKVAHAGESLLSRMRDGELRSNTTITSALLETVDAVRYMLGEVEAGGNDGNKDYPELIAKLKGLTNGELTEAQANNAELSQAPALPQTPAPTKAESDGSQELLAAVQAIPEADTAPLVDHTPQMTDPPRIAIAQAALPMPVLTVVDVRQPPIVSTQASRDTSLAPIPGVAGATHAPDKSMEPGRPSLVQNADASASTSEHANAQEAHGAAIAENVRVDVALLDSLVDLAGELVLTRNHIVQLAKERDDSTLATATQRLNFVTAQMQDGIMRMRMQPVSTLLTKFPRMVRDLARTCRKLVRLEVDGGDTELDKSLIEAIKGPLTHLLRNCVDHGVETPEARVARGKHPEGRIGIRSYHQNGMVHIEVSDDGGGLPLGKIRDKALARGLLSPERALALSDGEVAGLIFLPGFSTAEQVTNVSGRGVGMDVVKTNVEQIGGTVHVDTKDGLGSTFTLKIPLTLAIIPALIVRSDDSRYAIPQVNVVEMLRLHRGRETGALEWIHGTPVYRLRGNLLPVVFLEQALGGYVSREAIEAPVTNADEDVPAKYLVVLSAAGRSFGLVVDAVLDQQEIVVKPMPKLLSGMDTYAGATLLGDGRVALILDALGIAQRAQVISELREDSAKVHRKVEVANSNNRRTLLLLRGPDDARLAIPLDDVSRLETIDKQHVESGGDHDVVQYRGEIMPLVTPASLLPERRSRMRNADVVPITPTSALSVVVLGSAEEPVGLVIDDVLDVVETSATLDSRGCRQGVKGTLVINERVTEVLDLEWIATTSGLRSLVSNPSRELAEAMGA